MKVRSDPGDVTGSEAASSAGALGVGEAGEGPGVDEDLAEAVVLSADPSHQCTWPARRQGGDLVHPGQEGLVGRVRRAVSDMVADGLSLGMSVT